MIIRMKFVYTILAAAVILLPACETARDATSDAGNVTGQALAKTGSAVEHGGEKLENATQ
jgi:predicted small secreted protein